jgi:hypothetical protein
MHNVHEEPDAEVVYQHPGLELEGCEAAEGTLAYAIVDTGLSNANYDEFPMAVENRITIGARERLTSE